MIIPNGLFLPETAPPPVEKSSISSVSRVFVLLLIALVAVGGLAGGAAAWVLTIDFDGPYGPSGENSLTYTGKGDAAADSFWINRPVNSGGNIGDSRLMYGQNPGTELTISPREGYYVDGIYDESETPAKKLFDGNGYVVGYDNNKYLIYNPPGTQGEFYNFNENYQTNGVTLKVKWVANTTTVRFDVGDGSTPTVGTIHTGDTGIANGLPVKPTREGYSLYDWWYYNDIELFSITDGKFHPYYATNGYTDPNSKFTINQNGGNWTALVDGADITVTPKWDAITNEIIFNANGGTFPTLGGTELTHTGAKGQTDERTIYVEDPDNYEIPTKDGFIFEGWGLSTSGPAVISGQNKTISGGWEADRDHLEILPNANADPHVKNGKWIGVEYDNRQDKVTLYAVWKEIPKEQPKNEGGTSSAIILIGSKSSGGGGPDIEYKYVTFNANGGLGEMAKQQFTPGQTKALNANQFTFEGKNFAGWALEPTGMVVYTNGQEIMLDEDITVYAVWVEPIPDTPAIPGADDETGIPTWLAVLIVAVILVILIAVLVYFLVIRRGAA